MKKRTSAIQNLFDLIMKTFLPENFLTAIMPESQIQPVQKLDKKGRPFTSFVSDWRHWQNEVASECLDEDLFIKSVVVYQYDHGVRMLVNYGGFNRKHYKRYSGNKAFIVKKVNDECFLLIHKNKVQGMVEGRQIRKILRACGAEVQCPHSGSHERIYMEERVDGSFDAIDACRECGDIRKAHYVEESHQPY